MYERLIDEYVGKVTKDMGAEQRVEVGRELTSHIYDSSEAIAAKRGTAIDEAIVSEVLSKMMAPDKLAAMYPSKETFLRKSGVWKAVQGLGGIAVAFLVLAGLIYVIVPEAGGMTLGVILPVVSALALAVVVLAAIFFAVYLYESRLQMTYEARLRRLIRNLEYPASPLEIGIVVVLSLFGLVFVTVLWPHIPFLADFGTGRWVPLFSPAYAMLVPYYVLWLIIEIVTQILYVALKQKWIPSLMETGLSLASALLTYWLLRVFPFNQELSMTVQAGIKVLLAIFIICALIDAAKKLWQTGRFFIYGDYREFEAA